MIIFSMKQYIV